MPVSMLEQITNNFTESIQTQIAASELLASSIEHAGMMIVQCLLSGNKIISCGNGGSAGHAQHFCAQLLNKYETERPKVNFWLRCCLYLTLKPLFDPSAEHIALVAL